MRELEIGRTPLREAVQAPRAQSLISLLRPWKPTSINSDPRQRRPTPEAGWKLTIAK